MFVSKIETRFPSVVQINDYDMSKIYHQRCGSARIVVAEGGRVVDFALVEAGRFVRQWQHAEHLHLLQQGQTQ